MNAPLHPALSRRALLARGGALVVSFSLLGSAASAQEAGYAVSKPREAQNKGEEPRGNAPKLPGSLKGSPMLDSWIRIDADGSITVFTGKSELGQGIRTALLQVAAEELDVDPHAIALITSDTGRTPNEGYTAGSHSMQDSGTAILNAAAQVRALLIQTAAGRLDVPADQLKTENGAVVTQDGRRLGYGELVAGDVLHVRAQPQSPFKDPKTYTVMGTAMPRVDIPAKVTGGVAYVQDLRPEGMVHARVVRPPGPGAKLRAVDTARVEKMPGVLEVIRDGSFLAVVAEREFQAIQAMRALTRVAQWDEQPTLPDESKIFEVIETLAAEPTVILDRGAYQGGATSVEATYRRAYQLHGSIGPSCSLAQFKDGALTVWSHAQGMFPLRQAIAQMVQLPSAQVRCIHVEGSGCYGHNGADDAAADAALIAHRFPDRPVRVQWMREQENATEPYGPAMITRAKASLDRQGKIVGWDYAVWSNTHSMRPGPAGNLVAAQLLANPFPPAPPKPLPQPEGGGDRNAIPLYGLPNARVLHNFIPAMPLRVSAMRGLGAYVNVFAIESFMDELAAAAGIDPVAFRLQHMEDARARDVIQLAADKFGWGKGKPPAGRGRGFAFARYKNLGAYAAVAVEVAVDRNNGRTNIIHAVAAVDSGQVVNPDGIRNQIEGGIIQSASWTLFENVTFDRTRITSRDWSGYPILRFGGVPGSIEVHIINRPGQPFLGTGEATQGPTAGALANAIADATGVRLRDIPLTHEKVKAAIGV